MRYVRIPKAAELLGDTEKCIRRRIDADRALWVEGREYVRAPDDSIYIDLQGAEKWILGNQGRRPNKKVIA